MIPKPIYVKPCRDTTTTTDVRKPAHYDVLQHHAEKTVDYNVTTTERNMTQDHCYIRKEACHNVWQRKITIL